MFGAAVATLNLATTEVWNDKQGQKQEKTEWHRLTFFGRLVDIVEQWVKKGAIPSPTVAKLTKKAGLPTTHSTR